MAAATLAIATPRGSVHAQFGAERLVTDGSGEATQAATGLDIANNAYISSVVAERIRVKILGPDLEVDVPLPAEGEGQGEPDFATTSSGVTYMSFNQVPPGAPPEEGREIYVTSNGGGGPFHEPLRLTTNRVDDQAPRLALDEAGQPSIVWASLVGEASHVLFQTVADGVPGPVQPVASGEFPQLHVDASGVAHVIYTRQNDIFYNHNRGGVWNHEVPVTTTPLDPEGSAAIAGDLFGTLHVCFESRGSLYMATARSGEEFTPPRLLDAGGVLDVRLRVRPRGQVTLVYSKNGDIFYILGQEPLGLPQRVMDTPEVESHPSLEVDSAGNIHLSYVREGDVYYSNNATTPVADFSANTVTGEAPLRVQFADLSNGNVQLWQWDFGDGATSTEQHPVHVYAEPGKYSVTLRVAAPGVLEAERTRTDFIFAQSPFNTLTIADQRVYPGQKEIWFPVLATHPEPMSGFQLLMALDPTFLTLDRYEFAFTPVGPLGPEQVCFNDKGTYLEMCCIFQFFPPIDESRRYLRGGSEQPLVNIVADVKPDAPQGAVTELRLLNDYNLSPVFNIFIVDGFSILPALTSSRIDVILSNGLPPRLFLRGDADGSGALDISDPVRILNYLFSGGAPPPCFDAADVRDRGVVDISSTIFLLGYLFLGGPPPSVPFPSSGLDPTPDSFRDC